MLKYSVSPSLNFVFTVLIVEFPWQKLVGRERKRDVFWPSVRSWNMPDSLLSQTLVMNVSFVWSLSLTCSNLLPLTFQVTTQMSLPQRDFSQPLYLK